MRATLPLACVLLSALGYVSARPSNSVEKLVLRDGRSFEWTAIGDSYAAGVGASKRLGWGRCFRYSGAYGEQMNDEPEGNGMPGEPTTRIFNFPACSGATTDAVLENQFRDTFYWDPIWGELHSISTQVIVNMLMF